MSTFEFTNSFDYMRRWLLESVPVELATLRYGELKTGEFIGYKSAVKELAPGTKIPARDWHSENPQWEFLEEFMEYIRASPDSMTSMHFSKYPSRIGPNSYTIAATEDEAIAWGRWRSYYTAAPTVYIHRVLVRGKVYKVDAAWLDVVLSTRPMLMYKDKHEEFDKPSYKAAMSYWRGYECRQSDSNMPEVLVEGEVEVIDVFDKVK